MAESFRSGPFLVWGKVYVVGGAEISHPDDCLIYLIDAGELVLIDCGAGESLDTLVANIVSLDLNPQRLRAVVATHAHIDHIGALARLKRQFGVSVIAHKLDANAIETGNRVGAEFYGLRYEPCPVDVRLRGDGESLRFGGQELKVVHIPGHTPGSIALFADMGKRILFGQDVHGPYTPILGGDPAQAALSLRKLLALEADILCEGHFGIYRPAEAVKAYIEGFLRQLEPS